MRLLVCGASSVLLATAALAMLAVRRWSSPLLTHSAIQTAAWGAIDVAVGAFAWLALSLRALAGAVDRFVWLNIGLNIGLDAGYVAVGATLAIVGWKPAHNLGLVKAGCGVVLHGAALPLMDLVLASVIARG